MSSHLTHLGEALYQCLVKLRPPRNLSSKSLSYPCLCPVPLSLFLIPPGHLSLKSQLTSSSITPAGNKTCLATPPSLKQHQQLWIPGGKWILSASHHGGGRTHKTSKDLKVVNSHWEKDMCFLRLCVTLVRFECSCKDINRAHYGRRR